MEDFKPITWFKGDKYEDFCLIRDNNDRLLKCTVEKDPSFGKFILRAAVGHKVTPEYVDEFTKNDTGWSVSDVEEILKMDYHFPKFVYIESFDSLKQAQDFVDQTYQINLEQEKLKKQVEQPYTQLSLLNNKKLSDFNSLDALVAHILQATTYMSLIED